MTNSTSCLHSLGSPAQLLVKKMFIYKLLSIPVSFTLPPLRGVASTFYKIYRSTGRRKNNSKSFFLAIFSFLGFFLVDAVGNEELWTF